MSLVLDLATVEDAAAIAELRTAAAEHLTERYGKGFWSSPASEKGVLYALRSSRVYVARSGPDVVATLRLAAKKPWAIDRTYFSPCEKPLYLTDMAVAPAKQRLGIGRFCLDEAMKVVRDWPADAIRLDAFDADAGAGEFYIKCGFEARGRVSYRGTPLLYFEKLLMD